MTRFTYASMPGGFRDFRGSALTALTGLPAWGRLIVMLLALPGIVLIALSLVMLAASVAALLILTLPAYTLLRRLLDGRPQASTGTSPAPSPLQRPARRVEATVT